MTPTEAAMRLHLFSPHEPAEVVRAAYAREVKQNHPDYGGDGTQLAFLKVARDTLLSHSDIIPCVLCKGSGSVRGRFGAQTCTACGGSGDRP